MIETWGAGGHSVRFNGRVSNSMIAWVIARAALWTERLVPPPRGRAPGWDAGLEVARRQQGERTGRPDGSRPVASALQAGG